jgi:hypothetical protein
MTNDRDTRDPPMIKRRDCTRRVGVIPGGREVGRRVVLVKEQNPERARARALSGFYIDLTYDSSGCLSRRRTLDGRAAAQDDKTNELCEATH